jgi:hypothetical protein
MPTIAPAATGQPLFEPASLDNKCRARRGSAQRFQMTHELRREPSSKP